VSQGVEEEISTLMTIVSVAAEGRRCMVMGRGGRRWHLVGRYWVGRYTGGRQR